ncbi:TetR/AcrR family transcriptional regulator [Tsukamurella pseudospumae]|uniref:HTH tetR-type domain-containing protein n=1 Tax=Tsukamurella pseudospumae TaxID=239498 RepID=A0A138A7N9_9ACTN|nr:TetR/AcrR family transcriptional regulator [Tsukamurella pseudospumae]KXP06482.1 hypothetical protein AXK60_10365 [Tsukamurella pseudospumae]
MPTSSPGRPRSAAAKRAIVNATLAELEAVGYQALTIEAVARRAGVGRPTIYRRWPDRDALIVGALTATVPQPAAPSTDDPVADLRTSVATFISGIARSPAARAVLAVHAAAANRPDLRTALHEHYLAPRNDALVSAIERARASGAIGAGVTDEQVRDLLVGPAIYRWLVIGEVPDAGEHEVLLDLALAAIARDVSGPGSPAASGAGA